MDAKDAVRHVAIALGSVIRNERKMFSLTQQELAEFAGVDRAFISSLEHAHQNPSLLTLAKLAIAFNRRLDDFLELVAQKAIASRQVQLMLNIQEENPAAPLISDEGKVKEVING